LPQATMTPARFPTGLIRSLGFKEWHCQRDKRQLHESERNRNPCASGASAYELYEALYLLDVMGAVGLSIWAASFFAPPRVPPKAALETNFCILNILCYNTKSGHANQHPRSSNLLPSHRQTPTIYSTTNAGLAMDLARCRLEKAMNDRVSHI
jgi:hypothetical protein